MSSTSLQILQSQFGVNCFAVADLVHESQHSTSELTFFLDKFFLL